MLAVRTKAQRWPLIAAQPARPPHALEGSSIVGTSPPQHSSGCLLRSFRWLESQLRWHLCTCHTTGWPLSTGLKLECLAQMAATGLDVGLRMDMQVCQDPMSFTPSVMIPLAGWQQGEPGNTVHIPTGVNAPGVGGLDYVMTMTGKADHIQLTATVDACLLGACTTAHLGSDRRSVSQNVCERCVERSGLERSTQRGCLLSLSERVRLRGPYRSSPS